MKKMLVVLTLVLLLMAVAEYFSIDPDCLVSFGQYFRLNRCFFSRGWNSGLQYMWNDVEGPETLATP